MFCEVMTCTLDMTAHEKDTDEKDTDDLSLTLQHISAHIMKTFLQHQLHNVPLSVSCVFMRWFSTGSIDAT